MRGRRGRHPEPCSSVSQSLFRASICSRTVCLKGSQRRQSVHALLMPPLGSRAVTGIVVDVSRDSSARQAQTSNPLRQVLDTEPFIPSDVVELARWTAEHYAAGAGEAITAAVLPPKTRGTPRRCAQDRQSRLGISRRTRPRAEGHGASARGT